MKILELKAENVMRLVAVEITPDGTMQVIAGNNGAGKSSVLNAIWLALGGGGAKKATVKPVRDGEESGFVFLDLGDLKVTRRWNQAGDTTSLVVETADGMRPKSPQALLDTLMSRMTFDPVAFTMLPAREQRAVLLGLVDLPFELDEIDARRADVYATRTDANRKVKDLRAQLDDTIVVPDTTPDEEVSAADLIAQINAATDTNRRIDAARSKVLQLQREAAELEQRLTALREAAEAAQADLTALGNPVDVDPLQAALTGIEQTNRDVREKQRRTDMQVALADAKARAKDLDDQIETIDREKADGLAAATFPVDGLGFDDSGVTYQGIPFSQASSAEQIRVSFAIAAAQNPQLRVVAIKDGSLLDDTSMELVRALAVEHDIQVWIERVGTADGGSAVVIEAGEVAS